MMFLYTLNLPFLFDFTLLDINIEISNISALTPLLLIKNSINSIIKTIFGLYVKFIHKCINSAVALNLIFIISLLAFTNYNVVTSPLLLASGVIFVSALSITFLLNFNKIKVFIIKASKISEVDLLQTFTLKNSIILGGAIVAGQTFAKCDAYVHKQLNTKYAQDYATVMKDFNEPVDKTIIKDIMTRKSVLDNISSSLPHLINKSAPELTENLENSNKNK